MSIIYSWAKEVPHIRVQIDVHSNWCDPIMFIGIPRQRYIQCKCGNNQLPSWVSGVGGPTTDETAPQVGRLPPS